MNKKKVETWIEPEFISQIDQLAKLTERSRSYIIRKATIEYLKKEIPLMSEERDLKKLIPATLELKNIIESDDKDITIENKVGLTEEQLTKLENHIKKYVKGNLGNMGIDVNDQANKKLIETLTKIGIKSYSDGDAPLSLQSILESNVEDPSKE